MKLPNRPYRPQVRVEDIRRPSSYYQASDVAATPFTRIGQLIDVHEKSTEITPETVPTATSDVAPIEINNHHTSRPPIFPANFLMQTNTGFGQAHENTAAISREQPRPSRTLPAIELAGLGAALAAFGSHAVHALTQPWQALRAIHPAWAHRRYIVDRGWQVGLLENAKRHSRTIAAVGFGCLLVLLLVFLRPGAPKSPTRGGNGAAGSDTYSQTSNATRSSNKSATASTNNANPSNSSATTSTSSGAPVLTSPTTISGVPVSSSSSSPAAGGMGSGPSGTGTGVPGVTIPVPITVPGQSVDTGGKQIVGTDPVGITLN